MLRYKLGRLHVDEKKFEALVGAWITGPVTGLTGEARVLHVANKHRAFCNQWQFQSKVCCTSQATFYRWVP